MTFSVYRTDFVAFEVGSLDCTQDDLLSKTRETYDERTVNVGPCSWGVRMFLRVFVAYYRLLVFLLLTCGASHVLGEDIVREGVITDVKDEIGKLIHLRPVGNRQGIDREHWEKMTGSKTDEEKEQDQIDAMVKRGIPMKIAKQMVEQGGDRRGRGGFRRRGFGGDFLTDTAAGQLFEELKIASGAMSGGGGGGRRRR